MRSKGGGTVSSRSRAMVSVANQKAVDFLEGVFCDLGSGFSISYETPSEASVQYAFDITKNNMKELYEKAPEWGWQDDTKMKELTNPKQHTLFVKDENGQKRGIACFRWLVEADEPVLYLYEIQLEEAACRIGLGTKIMRLVENMAARSRMAKVCLTVLLLNVAAVHFYRKLGYTNNTKVPPNCSYRILSKKIKPNPEAPIKY